MKYSLILLLAFAVFSQQESIFETDFSDYNAKFKPFQTTTTATIIEEDSNQVLYFGGATTKYSGVITTDWIVSPSGHYYISVECNGANKQRTGAFLGYIRSDNENIYKALGLDADLNMDIYQIFKFNSTGEWSTYLSYLPLPEGVNIKLIFEKGSYFGNNDNYAVKFRNLKVRDLNLQDLECPLSTGEMKIVSQGYVTFLFFNNDLDDKIFTDANLNDSDESKGVLKFQYPTFFAGCLSSAFYGFNKDGEVIEDFQPTLSSDKENPIPADQQSVDTYTYAFDMNGIETLGCPSKEITCKGDKTCTLYTCDYTLHFWYETEENTFASHQKQYVYTKTNSQAIFTNSFMVQVYKEEETVLNTYVKTLEIDKICTGSCILNLDLTLELQVKTTSDGTYAVPTSAMTVIWGDYLYFKIKSTPSDYELELMKIIITTNSETVEMGEIFISSFVQNQKMSDGELTFGMMISGEAGLTEGKQFNLQFLTKSTASSRRLLVESTKLPEAALSGSVSFTAGDAEEKKEESASKLSIILLVLLAILLL